MDVDPVGSFRRMPRRRRRLLAAGTAALVLVLLAFVSIYRAATDPVVEGDSGPSVALPDTEPGAEAGAQAGLAPDSVQDLLTAAGGEAGTIFGSLPVPGPCDESRRQEGPYARTYCYV